MISFSVSPPTHFKLQTHQTRHENERVPRLGTHNLISESFDLQQQYQEKEIILPTYQTRSTHERTFLLLEKTNARDFRSQGFDQTSQREQQEKEEKKHTVLTFRVTRTRFDAKSPTHPRLYPKEDGQKTHPILPRFVKILSSRSGSRSYDMFEAMDIDRDGVISVQDFQHTCRVLSLSISPGDVHSLFRFIDLNGNGSIEFGRVSDRFENRRMETGGKG